MQILLVSAFAAGVWLLQQQSNLPSLSLLFWLVASVSLFTFVLFKSTQSPAKLKRLMMLLAAGLFGFFYAASFATFRLSDELPKGWEQKNIEVEGVVSSMAERNAYGERFRFDVERVVTPEASEHIVPKQITLNYYQKNAWQATATMDSAYLLSPSIFKAGQRWRFTVRLKRPHTTYNPNGYDFEAWALAQNIRAMGYIRNQNDMNKLADFVWRPRYMIEYCREKVGGRITQALANQPYAGVIRALVVGDHSQISAIEWEVYLRTGTNHLMSIFYLLKRK